MTPTPLSSPLRVPTVPTVKVQLPQGCCRYILTAPELKGHRCGCTGFEHNRTMPGATCYCGHLSCFHVKSAEAPSPRKHGDEMEALKQRIQLLEQSTQGEQYERLCSIVTRVSQVEDMIDKNREDTSAELKGSYRNIHAAWQLIEQLQKRMNQLYRLCQMQSDRMERFDRETLELRNRYLELVDSDESLEERIEELENASPSTPPALALEKSSPFAAASPAPAKAPPCRRRASFGHAMPSVVKGERLRLLMPPPSLSAESSLRCLPAAPWTIHVSLLPSKEQPFPFEKDTTAYKRCLSRGLHRMIVVDGVDAESFIKAVAASFEGVLKGRPWIPLQARLCEAQKLQGLPMLRPLEAKLVGNKYDAEFLQRHCALCDEKGKMDSLYVAMQHGSLSWDFLRQSPVYLGGLESCWDVVDQEPRGPCSGNTKKEEGKQLAANNPIPSSRPTKRPSSAALDESEMPRKRLMGSCKTAMMEMRREVRTA